MDLSKSKSVLLALFAALNTAAFAQSDSSEDEEVFIMSPFEVTTDNDKGYYAANSISGSRIDVRIQDLPLTIEVVTSEFIEDTGSTDLRESLRYSAGILLESQNDAYGTFDNAGGVNNPEGATGAQSDTGFKIRGFVTNNTLRAGFRRQHSTDSVNIERVEVVRGPSALLYGVGNFGGVVNYLPKTPLPEFETRINLGVGSDGWKRASFDTTGPISDNLGYRVTGAIESSDDWTDHRTHDHQFISPVFEWKWNKTKILVDIELGTAEDRGVSFKSVRAPTIAGIPVTQSDRLETYGFLEFDGEDPKTFRWSGPDTYGLTTSWNANVQLEQELIDNMFFLIGYNKSYVKFDNRDLFGGINTSYTPSSSLTRAVNLLDTIEAIQIIDGSNSDVRIPVDNTVLQYLWDESERTTKWDQFRAELNYNFYLFEDSKWLSSKHSILAGYSWESQENSTLARGMDNPNDPIDSDPYIYKNPTDSNVIRFDAPTDGTGIPTFFDREITGSTGENEGYYAVYNMKLFDEKLFLIGGVRKDVSSSLDGFSNFNTQATRGDPWVLTEFEDSEVSKTTTQWGISYEILDGFTVYALSSEGIEPNFGGVRDGNGVALDSSSAVANEFGFKFNLFDSKIAASFSFFKIEREGVPFTYWWAPAPATGRFDRDADIVYRLEDWNLEAQLNSQAQNGTTPNPFLLAAKTEWDAAVASRGPDGQPDVVFQAVNQDSATKPTNTYLNASTPEGAAYLDRVFDLLNAEYALPRDQRSEPWPGWLYPGAPYAEADSNVNFSTMDYSAANGFSQSIEDQSEGWEAQIILSPIDEFQLVLNYSNVERTVVSPGNFVSYPYSDGNWDRWAAWYFPNGNWGLAGTAPEVAYPGGAPGLPSEDTSDWAGVGWGQGESLDDTPEHVISWWASWSFNEDAPLYGLQLGFGGQWESEREYASALTTAGQQKQNSSSTSIKASTDPRLTLNGMMKYTWETGDNETEWYVQLNVDNFLDDTDQYGLLYAPGISWRFQTGWSF